MKALTAVLIILATVVCAGIVIARAPATADAAETLSGAEALRVINAASVRETPQTAARIDRLLSPELARETDAAETLSVRELSGGLFEVVKANGVVLVYDGEPDCGELIGARISAAD